MRTDEAYNILDIVNEEYGIILTKGGNVCISFKVKEPECYSLSREDIDLRDKMLKEAFRFLPEGCYIHKQDIFQKKYYHSVPMNWSFLDIADAKHFENRLYMQHTCVLHFVLTGLKSLEKSYISSPLKYKENLHKDDLEKLSNFLEAINNCISILKNLRDTQIISIKGDELRNLILGYSNLFVETNAITDIHVDNELHVGKIKARYFCICDETMFPDNSVSSYVKDSSLPMANAELYHPLLEELGMYLPYNHIVNQIIYLEGNEKLRAQIARNIDIYGSNSSMSKSIKVQFEKLDKLQEEILEENEILVRTHFSVCIFDEPGSNLDKAEKTVKETLNINQFKYYIPGYENLAKIHFSCVPGQISCMPKEYLVLTTLPIALCLFLQCSEYMNGNEGIFVHDRMYQIPLRKDIWDAAKKRVNARNGMIIAGTGGGKSAFTLNFTQQLIEQDYTCIVVEFGKSFSQLCKLYPEISLHVDYDGKTPLGINPFELQGKELDNNDLEMLSGIIQRYWKHMFTKDESEKEVALTRFIQDYYEQVSSGHNFENFYRYVTENYNDILKRKNVVSKYFDLESFKLNCGEFMPGQRYENVCKDIQMDFASKKFIVFELTQIKQDRFLSNLVMSMIFSIIQKKLLSDRRKRGILIFDEYAETAQMTDTATGTGIHSSVAFCYQKIRKENGAVYTIVQTPEQLPDDENTKNIISNTDMLFVLPTKEVIYQSIIDKFKITRDYQIALMKSMRNNFSGPRPYSECFMRMGENYATVTRLEFSKEKFLAFQTEGEIWSELEEKTQRMSMQDAITEYINEHKK